MLDIDARKTLESIINPNITRKHPDKLRPYTSGLC
jgi:hypothetical protein